MTRDRAQDIVATWKYPDEYSAYDYINEADFGGRKCKGIYMQKRLW